MKCIFRCLFDLFPLPNTDRPQQVEDYVRGFFIRRTFFLLGFCKVTFHYHSEVLSSFGSTVETVI